MSRETPPELGQTSSVGISNLSMAGFSSSSFAAPMQRDASAITSPLDAPVAVADRTRPLLGAHLGRFEHRSVRVLAMVLSTEEMVRSTLSKLSKESELCPRSLFTEGAPATAVANCTRVWKERMLLFEATNDGWQLTISKTSFGQTNKKLEIPLTDVRLVKLTECPSPQQPFVINTRSSIDTKEGTTNKLTCTSIISISVGDKWVEFTCRKRETALSAYDSLQMMMSCVEDIKRLRSALQSSALGTAEEVLYATIRISDLQPMKRPAANDQPPALTPLRARTSAQFKSLPPVPFACTMSLVTNKKIPELKLKGSAVDDTLVVAAAGNFDAADGIYQGPLPIADPNRPRSFTAKLVVLLDDINADPPVVNNGQALVVWVEADRDQMLPARLTLGPKSKHKSIAELKASFVATIETMRRWQAVLDGVPAVQSASRASTPASAVTSPLVAAPSSTAAVPSAALINMGDQALRKDWSATEQSELFGRNQLLDLESSERHVITQLRLATGKLLWQAEQRDNSLHSGGGRSTSPYRHHHGVAPQHATRSSVSPQRPPRYDGKSSMTATTTEPQPYLGLEDVDYRSVVGHILRHRASRHSALQL